MNVKKFAMAIALTASFGLMACGDDSSSSSNTDEKFVDLNGEPMKCTVEEDNDTVITTIKAGQGYYTSKIYITDLDVMTESETHYVNYGSFNDECEKAKQDEGTLYSSVECKDKVISITEKGELFKGYTLDDVKAESEAFCKAVDGVKYKKLNEKIDEFYGDGDDKTLNEVGEIPMECSVKREKDAVIVNLIRENGSYETKFHVDGEFLVSDETAKFTHYTSYWEKCAEVKEDRSSYESTLCRGDAILTVEKEPLEDYGSLDEFQKVQEAVCKALDGKKSKDFDKAMEEFMSEYYGDMEENENTEDVDDSIDFEEEDLGE